MFSSANTGGATGLHGPLTRKNQARKAKLSSSGHQQPHCWVTVDGTHTYTHTLTLGTHSLMPTDTQKHSETHKHTLHAHLISHRHTRRYTTSTGSDTPTQAGSETHRQTQGHQTSRAHTRTLTHTLTSSLPAGQPTPPGTSEHSRSLCLEREQDSYPVPTHPSRALSHAAVPPTDPGCCGFSVSIDPLTQHSAPPWLPGEAAAAPGRRRGRRRPGCRPGGLPGGGAAGRAGEPRGGQ